MGRLTLLVLLLLMSCAATPPPSEPAALCGVRESTAIGDIHRAGYDLEGMTRTAGMRLWTTAPVLLLIDGVEVDLTPDAPYTLAGTERGIVAFGDAPFRLDLCAAGAWPDGRAPHALAFPWAVTL